VKLKRSHVDSGKIGNKMMIFFSAEPKVSILVKSRIQKRSSTSWESFKQTTGTIIDLDFAYLYTIILAKKSLHQIGKGAEIGTRESTNPFFRTFFGRYSLEIPKKGFIIDFWDAYIGPQVQLKRLIYLYSLKMSRSTSIREGSIPNRYNRKTKNIDSEKSNKFQDLSTW